MNNLNIETCFYSGYGARDENEDHLGFLYDGERGVWTVADGLGAHAFSKVASKLAVECINKEGIKLNALTESEIVNIIYNADKVIKNKQIELNFINGMKTTVVSAFLMNNTLKSIHVGDSRFYYFRKNDICYQSKDHSVSQLAVDLGEIKAGDIRFHEERNFVTKVLGSSSNYKYAVDFSIEVKLKDAFLLCTDGFWELIYEAEMEDMLKKSISAKAWLANMLKIIKKRINKQSDNYTAICCKVL